MNKQNIYDTVNKSIITQLEKGEIPWRMPWKTTFPINLANKKRYGGINYLILTIEQMNKNYKSNVWATFKQISEKNGRVKAGQKSTVVIFWKILEQESTLEKDKNGKPKIEKIPLLRYYNVFNLDQTEGIKTEDIPVIIKENKSAEDIINTYKQEIEIKYGGSNAFYRPQQDFIQIPDRKSFTDDGEFYATNFHEMVHSTGNEKRLNRFGGENYNHNFGSEDYSKEELVAELGSAYLCAETNILPVTLENTAAYIQSWLKALKNDKSLLVAAGGKAQKAVNYILK